MFASLRPGRHPDNWLSTDLLLGMLNGMVVTIFKVSLCLCLSCLGLFYQMAHVSKAVCWVTIGCQQIPSLELSIGMVVTICIAWIFPETQAIITPLRFLSFSRHRLWRSHFIETGCLTC